MSTATTQTPTGERRTARLTVAKYEAMIAAGILTEKDRVELIEGRLVEKTTKGRKHIASTVKCREAVARVLPPGWHARAEQPVSIPGRDSMPEPDVSVARGVPDDYLERDPGRDDVPLVVEVADSSLAGDRAMAATYGGGGFAAYWLVNIPERQVEVYTEPSGPATPAGYRRTAVFHPGQAVPLEVEGREVARIPVVELLPREEGRP